EPLKKPILLCLFDGKPAAAGFIHQSVSSSIVFPDLCVQHLNFFVTTLHPSAPIVLGLPWLRTTNPVIDWPTLSISFRSGSGSNLPTMTTAMSSYATPLPCQDRNLAPYANSPNDTGDTLTVSLGPSSSPNELCTSPLSLTSHSVAVSPD